MDRFWDNKIKIKSVALIISVYKNTRDLEVVLRSIEQQTFCNIQIVLSEDGDSKEMQEFINSYSGPLKLKHLSQPDKGWQKNKALNNAIRLIDTDYFIFIDGDCVLHPNFIENHIKLARENRILAGKRIKLGENFSDKLRNCASIKEFSKEIISNFKSIHRDGAKFYEEGIYISPKSWFSFIARFRSMNQLKGCNFSCYKSALVSINGFDEDYTLPAIGEDIDLTWRFIGLNYKLYSVRNFAVQYHLYHKENWTDQSENVEKMIKNQQQKKYVAINGLQKLAV